MVVTTPSEVDLQHWTDLLQNKATKVEDRIKAYQTITGFMKDGDCDKFDAFVTELIPVLETFLHQIYSDCKLHEGEVAQAALQTFGFFLFQDDLTKHISEADCGLVLNTLCDVIYQTIDKNTCTRALWCLAKQTLNTSVVAQKIEQLVSAIEHGQCQKSFKSMTVEHEALNALIRLLEQVPKAMQPLGVKWGPLVYGPLVHGAPLVRDRAVVAMEAGISYLLDSQEQLAKRLSADLKAEVLISEMKRLLKNGQESHVLTVWMYYIRLLGKTLHSGSLINHLLPIVEQGFKNPSPKVKVQAYKAWETLINNFALNPDILGDHKRVKLLMQVFRINNAKFENVAMAKLHAWWHLVVRLEDKLVQYFDQVCVPLLTFCVTGSINPLTLTPSGKNTKQTPNMQRLGPLGSPGTPSSPGVPQTFKSVQLKAIQVLGQIIGRTSQEPDNPKPMYSIALLKQEVLPGIHFFLKHEKTLVGVVMQAIINLGDEIEDTMLYYMWQSLVKYIQLSLEVTSKKEHSDCFSHFCTGLRDVVSSQSLNSIKILKMLHPVVNLPEKCLSSLAYQIDEAGVLNQGCPALFLIQLLTNHRLLETSSSNERFMVLWEKLIGLGFSNETAALSFCESVFSQLGQKAGNVESKETLWRMWSVVATNLTRVIKKTNEVNQGNNLEHDFAALYSALTFPDLHILTKDIPQGTMKTLLKTWGDLYATFSRLAAMVATVQGNLVCEELCALLLQGLQELPQNQEGLRVLLESLVQQCEVMIKHMDFSAFSQSTELDPSSFFGRKKELGNLTSFVQLLNKTLKTLQTQPQETFTLSPQCYLTLVSTVSSLFTHITSPQTLTVCVDKLAESVGYLLKGSFTKTLPKSFTTQLNQKSEKLWNDISSGLMTRCSGPYDSERLKAVSPMLEATFLHPRRTVKSQAMVLWNGMFSKSQALEYPDSLKHVLLKVKEKGHITLPGFDATTVTILDNTLGSQMTQGESQFAVPVVMSHKSPKKEFGSFLNKVMSPKKSPAKSISPTKEGIENRKKKQIPPVDITDMNSKDFVVISNTTKQQRVLTEHQREVMKEQRGNIPALYSNLEASMDTSLMAQLNNSNTQGESQMIIQSPERIEITPFPFMKSAGQTIQPSKKSTEKPHQQMKKDENQEKSGENPRKRRRRSVRFSDENPNISTDQELDENILKPGNTKIPQSDNKEPESKDESLQDTQSRRSKRIKLQANKSDDNENMKNVENKNSKDETDIGDTSDSVVILEEAKEVCRTIIPDSENNLNEEAVSDSGVICDVKTCDMDSENQVKQRRTSKRITTIESNVKKCDIETVKESPAKVQGSRRRSCRNDQKELPENDSAKNTSAGGTTLTKKNSTEDSGTEFCENENIVMSQELISSPAKSKQLKLADIVTPPRDEPVPSLIKSPNSALESADQSKSRKSRSGSIKSNQSDSDCSSVVDSPDSNTQIQTRKSRSASKSSQSDSDTCNVITDSPKKPIIPRQGFKSPVKSPLKQSKSFEIKSPRKYKSPKKQTSLDGMGTIDKWFNKSVKGASKQEEQNEENNKSEFKTFETVPNKTLFPKTFGTQACSVSLVRVDPVVMAEDTQQFSPIKNYRSDMKIVPAGEVSIVETPMKHEEENQKDVDMEDIQISNAMRKLSEEMDKTAKDIVMETQTDCSDSGLKTSKKATGILDSKTDCIEFSVAGSNKGTDLPERIFPKVSVAVEIDNNADDKEDKETLEDVMDDIIPSSQDSFGFSGSFSRRKGEKNNSSIERPFAMFSESEKSSNLCPENFIRTESSMESEPLICGQLSKSSPQGKNETETNVDITLTEENMSTDEVATLSEDDVTTVVSDVANCSVETLQGKNSESISSVIPTEGTSNENPVVNAGLVVKTTAEKDENKPLKAINNNNKADKYRSSRRRSERVKVLENQQSKNESESKKNPQSESGKNEDVECSQNEAVDTGDSFDLKASQEDDSQSLFGSDEKVKIVEIKRKTRGKKKDSSAQVVENESETKGDSGKAGMKKKKQNSITSNESCPAKFGEGNLGEKETSESTLEDVINADDRISKREENNKDQPMIKADTNNISTYSEDEDNISLMDLKSFSNKAKSEEPEKETESEDDIPLTDLKKISEKKDHGNSPECDFSVGEEEVTSLVKKSVLKKGTKQTKSKSPLKVDMNPEKIGLTKPKSRASPNSFLKIKLRRRSSDKLKLKKASPKRKRRSKELVHGNIRKTEINKGEDLQAKSSVMDTAEEDVAMVINNGEVIGEIMLANEEETCKNIENNTENQNTESCDDEKLKETVKSASHDVDQSSDGKSSDVTISEVKTDEKDDIEMKDLENDSEDPLPSPLKTAKSPEKPSTIKNSPPKKGKPFDIPATPTSSVSKVMGMTRADYIFQKSRLLMGRKATTPSPLHRRSLRAVRSAFSEPRRKQGSILKKFQREAESPVKTSEIPASSKTGSPPSLFRPVNLPQIYSPSASPSAGILKRRRISGDSPVDSPSPPNKQRRVSFADSVETRLFENPRSRLYRPSSPRPVSRCLDMPKNTTSPLVTAEVAQAKDEEVTPTPESVKSTQESQLNTVDPIYPSLVACDIPVEQILPQLTTSVWCRGLGQLLRGKNITTVGQLSMLTELQINNLPVRSPKIEVVTKTLEEFAKNWLCAKKEESVGDTLDSSIDSDPGILETSGDLLDDIKQLDEEIEEPTADRSPQKLNFPLEIEETAHKSTCNINFPSKTHQKSANENVTCSMTTIESADELAEVGDNRVSSEHKLCKKSENKDNCLCHLLAGREISELSEHELLKILPKLCSMLGTLSSTLGKLSEDLHTKLQQQQNSQLNQD